MEISYKPKDYQSNFFLKTLDFKSLFNLYSLIQKIKNPRFSKLILFQKAF
jgi:hypothetical protein